MMHVALAADENYFSGLLVCAWSIARCCSKPEQLTIHVLDGGIAETSWNLLKTTLADSDIVLDRIRIDQATRLANYPNYNGPSKMTFVRLFLDQLLPDVEQIVYSDVDVLWLADVCHLWESCPDSATLSVISEKCSFVKLSEEESRWFTDNQIHLDSLNYFCAGVIVFNLARIRETGFFAKALEILAANDYRLPQNDQTALNAVAAMRGDIHFLPSNWQTGTGNLPREINRSDIVIHYAQDAPWKTIQTNHHLLTEAILFWHKIHARLCGISTWRSLRQCNSVPGLILGRTLYWLTSRFAAMRCLIHLVMKLKGNAAGIPCIDAFMRSTRFAISKLMGKP